MNPPPPSPDVAQWTLTDLLLQRRADPGGFSPYPGEPPRSDATAWALLALRRVPRPPDDLDKDTSFLLSLQQGDGRFVLLPEKPGDSWVTAPALLALHGRAGMKSHSHRALEFLLTHTGIPTPYDPDVVGHDTRLRGWPWIENTHSWVDSTALVLLALRAHGRQAEALFQEAVRLLLDRQLPGGGWNVGNTLVYGAVTRPSPDSTGVALAALDGIVPDDPLGPSLAYLNTIPPNDFTPLCLAWNIIARPALLDPGFVTQRIAHFTLHPEPLPAFPTEWLALMCLALDSIGGIPPPWSTTTVP